MTEFSPQLIEHALATARKHGFAEVRLVSGDCAFEASLDALPKTLPTQAAVPAASEATNKPLKATQVGFFDVDKAVLKKGHRVEKGDVIGKINALGHQTDVQASASGEIVDILVKTGDAVEYGQPLAMVKP